MPDDAGTTITFRNPRLSGRSGTEPAKGAAVSETAFTGNARGRVDEILLQNFQDQRFSVGCVDSTAEISGQWTFLMRKAEDLNADRL